VTGDWNNPPFCPWIDSASGCRDIVVEGCNDRYMMATLTFTVPDEVNEQFIHAFACENGQERTLK